MSKNLDLFNQQTAAIFAMLWENFPVPQAITYEQLCSLSDREITDSHGVIDGTFRFLRESGYIQCEREHASVFYSSTGYQDVRLTEKALTILNKKLDALSGGETMGDKILSAVKDGTPGVIAGAVTNLLTLGVNLVTSGS
ncbi:MAG: hypothetical protein RSA95_07245 [Citrobacter sp.]|uniref:hypothetical protein n=1 Tax=Citrobacter sp. TaxID=1896336 RepID=UPI002FC62F90